MTMQHVLIAGGGPVGFLTALGLARHGLKVTLVEASPAIIDSPRAMVYHWTVLAGLERLGVLDDAMRIGFTKQDYANIFHRTGERIEWSVDLVADVMEGHPYNLHIGQNDIAAIARDHLKRHPAAEVRFATRLTGMLQDDHGVTATLAGPDGVTEERFDWLIGADGAASQVREKFLGLNFFGITWPERFVATNLRHDLAQHGFARANFVVDDVYGAVVARIDNNDLWRITFMEDAGLPLEGIEDRIQAFYKVYFPDMEGHELVQHSPYRMHQRCADTMRVGRVILAGDAAHITNPTGGLGLTSGLFDSYFLVEIMSAIANDGASHDLLERYSNERRRAFLEIASPQAVANKLRVYHSAPGEALDRDIAFTRTLPGNRDALARMMLFTRQLESRL